MFEDEFSKKKKEITECALEAASGAEHRSVLKKISIIKPIL